MTCIIADPIYTHHLTGPLHPECPERYLVIDRALTESHLKKRENTLAPKEVTLDQILLCHSKEYYQSVVDDIKQGREILSTGDVYISPESLAVAKLSAGGVITAVDAVMSGSFKNAFCLIRPPGHHATPTQGMGFCIFNNVAIGARYLQKKYGIKRVLIVDWDVHHGNGTQDIFYEDPSVFYFSTHQAGIYPGTGFPEETGRGAGLGYTLNCPIMADSDSASNIIHAFETCLFPKMEAFKPEFVFISCGFDALYSDPLAELNLTPDSFVTLTNLVKEIAEKYAHGRIVSCLEGGYDLNGISVCAVAHVQILNQ